ncbi:MAG: TonB-dependent receptor [Paludibacter sp.]|jgi:TonB-linked SusC/RagA family outer membrane protein|nr:TonB-dependent receptor [Paludibacter sp.]
MRHLIQVKTLRIIAICAICLLNISVYAQTSVSGKVTDISGEPLIGATVTAKGSKNATITNTDGNYSLQVPTGINVLTFSYLGYTTQDVNIQGKQIVNVQLREENNSLNDVVVIGYGVAKKRDLTGAVASIKSEQILTMPVTQAAEALQGRVAGLDVTRGNGDAGQGVTIRLRGNRSVSTEKDQLANYNEPLTIVDGMQGVSLKDIPTSDIVSMDVLKDAASTAIYGARGANGVIIVTTKSGQVGRPRVSLNSYYGVSNVASYGEYMSTEQYVAYRLERQRGTTAAAGNNWLGIPKTAEDIFSADQMAKINAGNNTYWPGIALHQGYQQEHNFNLNAGNDLTKIYLSGSFYDEQGLLARDHYQRFTGRLNVDQKVYSWLDIGMRMQMAYSNNDKRSDPLNVARRIAPYETPYEDGVLVLNPGNIGNNANPLLDENPDNWQNNIYGTRFSGAVYVEIKPLKGLSLRSNLGVSADNSVNGMYYSATSVKAMTSSDHKNGGASKSQSDYRRFAWENILTYNKTFADIHNLTLTGVQSMEKSINTEMTFGDANPPEFPTLLWYAKLTNTNGLTGNYKEREYLSFAGRVGYVLLDKYIFNASVRYDASSKVNGNWAAFPSAGAAWRISDEEFVKNIISSDYLSNLKIRGSWGISGNDNSSDYVSQTTLLPQTGFTWNGSSAATVYALGTKIGNKDLTWERTSTYDFGVDLGVFDNRVNITFDYYNSKTTGLISLMQLPSTAGASETYRNFGEVGNNGYEILLETRNIANKKFQWNTTFTFASNKEKILSLPNGTDVINQYSRNCLIIGSPVEVAYGYIIDGVWQIDEADKAAIYGAKPGDIKFRDIAGGANGEPDNKITAASDRVVLGKMAPDFYGSMSNDLYWKGFDLNIFATFRVNYWYSSDFITKYDPNSENNAPFVNYWTPENPSGTFSRPGSSYVKNDNVMAHTMTLLENSFLKIRNITLGYTLPASVTKKIQINRLRVWASAKNMFIWQRDPAGFDPENVNNLGELMTDHPLNRLVTFGVNIDF